MLRLRGCRQPTVDEACFIIKHPGIRIIDDLGRAFLVEEIATHAN